MVSDACVSAAAQLGLRLEQSEYALQNAALDTANSKEQG
jgi:hypothetical protein